MSKVEKSENNRWLQQRWNELLREQGVNPLERVRKVRVQRLEVTAGRVRAQIASREQGSHEVELRWPPLNNAEWTKVVNALSEQALYAAQLLAGNFPAAVEQIFADVDLALLPDRLDEWRVVYAADAEAQPAETLTSENEDTLALELATIYQMLGEVFLDDPWLIFQLRGRDRQQLVQALREHRTQHANEGESDSASAFVPLAQRRRDSVLRIDGAEQQPIIEHSPALTDPSALDDFWGFGLRHKELQHHIEPPAVDLTLLRRLGPPPFVQQEADAYNTLAAIYRQVSAESLALAYADAPDVEESEK